MLHKLPQQITQTALSQLAAPDETTAVILHAKCPSIGPYTVRGKSTRRFVFPFCPRGRRKGHVLRVPLTVWESRDMALAKELLEQIPLPVPIIVSAEPWELSNVVAPRPAPAPPVEPPPGRDTDPAPAGPGLSAVPAPPSDPAPGEVDIPVRREGEDFFIGDQKIGGFNAAGHLQMSRGKADLRNLVQAFIDQQ